METIYTRYEDNIYHICFEDNAGQSILAKTGNYRYAMKLQKRFRKYLKEGRLLPVYKSTLK